MAGPTRLILNDDTIRDLRYPWGRSSKKRFFVLDTNGAAPPGFGVRVYPNNQKVYALRYYQGGRQRLVTLASVEWLTYFEARVLARACIRQVELGKPAIKLVEQEES